ncbi:hypothetical protein ACFYXM_12920 [Streptomyces sp. NPDC002476]|uniref:hypothetical protein n=1 Tax=Streptomyces sp. NPDC002476 TaxID=3364648 RepID=UPI0036B9D701
MSSRPMLNQREASAAYGVSRTAIRRREASALPSAVRDPHHGWLIPVKDLLAVRFRPRRPRRLPARIGEHHQEHDQDDVAVLRAELAGERYEHQHVDHALMPDRLAAAVLTVGS